MDNKKIIAAAIVSTICLGTFTMSLTFSDDEAVVQAYKSTVNGNFWQKALSVSRQAVIKEPETTEVADSGSTGATPVLPEGSEDITKWVEWVNSSKLSGNRKAILLEGLDTVSKGCVYHQLRSGNGTPDKCIVGGDGQHHPSHTGNYDFATMANFSAEDPLYLDCSFFIKHCYWKGGVNMKTNSTADMWSGSEWVDSSEADLVPGDIIVRRKNGSGHVILYLSKDSAGTTYWLEMKDHANDSKLSTNRFGAGYKAKRFHTLVNDVEV